MTNRKRQIRCAIYTRKSTEEGLDQEFNTLDAQREACTAYINSQAHEGWKPLSERYDDGGHSGGTMERPALQRLLDDIRDHRVDVIIVYKIDRLTRSLSDFARLAETFDEYGVSFVSVTQQFNTTTSMGRLTLNMLLSFAQFEREVTGERIRDKIAASKKKGMWMGGTTPTGYKVEDRRLTVVPEDAEIVRMIFKLYLDCGDVPALVRELDQRGIRTKRWIRADGTHCGGLRFQRGHLYRLLSNPVYIGRIPHREQSYPGEHQPIIDQETWDAVQRQLGDNIQGTRKRSWAASPSLLAGILGDSEGRSFTPAHASKTGRRYRYYVEQKHNSGKDQTKAQPRRIPAREIETAVQDGIRTFLASSRRLLDALGDSVTARETAPVLKTAERLRYDLNERHSGIWIEQIRPLLQKVIFGPDEIRIIIDCARLRGLFGLPASETEDSDDTIEITVPVSIRSRGNETKIVIKGGNGEPTPNPDMTLIKGLARAIDWHDRMTSGEVTALGDILREEGMKKSSYVIRMLRLACLAPDIIEAILNGEQPKDLTLDYLLRLPTIPMSWAEQRALLGFNNSALA